MKGPITNSSIEIKYNIDYLIVGSGLIMVCMNDSSIFCDDFYNLHLLSCYTKYGRDTKKINSKIIC